LRIRLPANDWRPRPYQLPAWSYLENGGKHAELIWHRRSGKDEITLHRTAIAAFERPANYWHMLPLAVQVRKAIWEAVNPHTGRKRIDEAFPRELRETTREQEMFIKFRNGATWQALGSDNFQSFIGSPPAGIVYSEWAQSNPSSRAYLRPILAENNGWQVFITTPRGKNHAYRTFEAARKQPGAFAQLLTALDTSVFSAAQLEAEREAYIADFGEDMGIALYEQEYLCSFEAAILGAYYGRELTRARAEGRITEVLYDDGLPVFTAWDLGYDDDCVIWFFQVALNEIHVIDYYASHGHDLDHYIGILEGKGYRYAQLNKKPFLWLPHDAKAKTLAAKGKSIQQQFMDAGYASRIVPDLSEQDGIQAARKTFKRVWIDEEKCADGLDALSQFRREWDEERKCFRDKPVQDWTNHAADAFRYMAVAWQEEMVKSPPPTTDEIIAGAKFPVHRTFNELREVVSRRNRSD